MRLPGSVRNQTTVVAAGVVSVALILAAFGLVGKKEKKKTTED